MCECRACGRKIKHGQPVNLVNAGFLSIFELCNDCADSQYLEGAIIKCENCGDLFTADVLKTEPNEFRPCPSCGKDVDEGLSRDEFDEANFCTKFSVIVQFGNGHKRGYMISAKTVKEMMEKLMAHVDLDYDCTINYSAILLDEDVIL